MQNQNNIRSLKERWEAVRKPVIIQLGDSHWFGRRYCELMVEKPLDFLQDCTKEDILAFLKWMHDTYHINVLYRYKSRYRNYRIGVV